MSGKKFALLMLLFLAISAGAVLAKDSGNSSGYQVIRESSGATKLRITTESTSDGMVLGVTLYAPKAKEGSSQLLPLKRGKNSFEIGVAPSFNNGTFEAAVWTKKTSKQECDKSDELCRKNGYKLIGMVSYLWGYLIVP